MDNTAQSTHENAATWFVTANGVGADSRSYRLNAIDILRGAVIVIMALDHVRDFIMTGSQQDPMRDPHVTLQLFVTRWITHFCAPTFVCLAGVSAGLMRQRKTADGLAAFLLKRGLWLILVEMLIISTALTFAPFGGPPVIVMQVIWAIGGSMVALAGVQYLGTAGALAAGGAIVLLHNLLDPVWPHPATAFTAAPWWIMLHTQAATAWDGWRIVWAYPLLPWIGVICLGYGAAPLFELPAARRNRLLFGIGWALTVAFVLLRAANIYGDPQLWAPQHEGTLRTLLSFLNVTKYPPSLLYLLMTLGPAAIFCAYADRLPAGLQRILITYGRVPFAFYVAHFYVIRATGLALGALQGFGYGELINRAGKTPPGYGLKLAGVYAVWAAVVVLLYPFCRWVASVKARRSDWWLSYV